MVLQVERYRTQSFRRQTKKGKVGWLIGACCSVLFPRLKTQRDVIRFYDNLARKIPYGQTEATGRAAWNTSVWPVVPLAVWGKPQYRAYNGIEVPLPADYDTCLRADYRDYMTLPPVEKRHPTHTYAERCPWWLGPTHPEG